MRNGEIKAKMEKKTRHFSTESRDSREQILDEKDDDAAESHENFFYDDAQRD